MQCKHQLTWQLTTELQSLLSSFRGVRRPSQRVLERVLHDPWEPFLQRPTLALHGVPRAGTTALPEQWSSPQCLRHRWRTARLSGPRTEQECCLWWLSWLLRNVPRSGGGAIIPQCDDFTINQWQVLILCSELIDFRRCCQLFKNCTNIRQSLKGRL